MVFFFGVVVVGFWPCTDGCNDLHLYRAKRPRSPTSVPTLAPRTVVGSRAAAPVKGGTDALAVLLAPEVRLTAAVVLLWGVIVGAGVTEELAAKYEGVGVGVACAWPG